MKQVLNVTMLRILLGKVPKEQPGGRGVVGFLVQ